MILELQQSTRNATVENQYRAVDMVGFAEREIQQRWPEWLETSIYTKHCSSPVVWKMVPNLAIIRILRYFHLITSGCKFLSNFHDSLVFVVSVLDQCLFRIHEDSPFHGVSCQMALLLLLSFVAQRIRFGLV